MRRLLMMVLAVLIIGFILTSCIPHFFVSKRVLIDDIHNNSYNFDGYGGAAYFASAVQILESMGYSVDFASDEGFNPEDYDVIILPAPVDSYSAEEMQKISDFLFVKNDRKLVVLGEYYSYYDNTPLNDLLSYLGSGISFNNALVRDSDNNYNSQDYWPIISDFVSHPVTTGVASIVLFAATYVDTTGSAEVVAYASSNAYLDVSSVDSERSSEILNPDITLASERIITSIPVIAVETLGNGNVVAIGDTNIFASDVSAMLSEEDCIDVYDNALLLKNIVNW